VFPDAAIETGAISNRTIIAAASWLERVSYQAADAVTVLSDDLRDNVVAKLGSGGTVHVIPNFVDTEAITPADRHTALRRELGIGEEPVVMYAGNVGFSQSLDMVVEAARRLPQATFVIHGDGAARASLEQAAVGLANVRFSGYLPRERLAEVLATGDVHLVPLKAGLGRVSVPSKTYSILAAGRPIVAAIDPGTEVPRLLAAADGGIAVPPDDVEAFVEAIRCLVDDPERAARLGSSGRTHVLGVASPAAVAEQYERLVIGLRRG
jgi:colanic acid biosynthesis glycosyl transferase WcaI